MCRRDREATAPTRIDAVFAERRICRLGLLDMEELGCKEHL